jgi:hypothetical protein
MLLHIDRWSSIRPFFSNVAIDNWKCLDVVEFVNSARNKLSYSFHQTVILTCIPTISVQLKNYPVTGLGGL